MTEKKVEHSPDFNTVYQYYKDTHALFSDENATTEMVDNYINQYWGMIRMEYSVGIDEDYSVYNRMERCFLIQLAFKEKYGVFKYYKLQRDCIRGGVHLLSGLLSPKFCSNYEKQIDV